LRVVARANAVLTGGLPRGLHVAHPRDQDCRRNANGAILRVLLSTTLCLLTGNCSSFYLLGTAASIFDSCQILCSSSLKLRSGCSGGSFSTSTKLFSRPSSAFFPSHCSKRRFVNSSKALESRSALTRKMPSSTTRPSTIAQLLCTMMDSFAEWPRKILWGWARPTWMAGTFVVKRSSRATFVRIPPFVHLSYAAPPFCAPTFHGQV